MAIPLDSFSVFSLFPPTQLL